MTPSLEYHGWIALATSQSSWDDGDFEQAFGRARSLLTLLTEEDGHSPHMPERSMLPRVIYLSGSDVKSIDLPLDVITRIARVFDRAYGELAVSTDVDGPWNSRNVRRYVLLNGRIQ